MPSSKSRNINRKKVSKHSTSTSSTPIHDEIKESDALEAQRILFTKLKECLPPGTRFVPSDVHLICDYLRPKIANQQLPLCLIHPINLYRYHPRTLAENYLKYPNGEEVYYFTPRDRKYRNGKRPNRCVEGSGYWKANGADVEIKLGDELIGYKKTLGFFEGKSPAGKKTNWIMHEFRTCESRKRTSNEDMKLDDWVLCRIRDKEETGHSKNKKNEEANANTNTSDTDIENDLRNPIADDNIVADNDEEDNRLNVNYCSISYQNQMTDHNEEANRLNANYGITYCHNELYQSHQYIGPPLIQTPPYLFGNSQGNFNMINGNYASGGPSYTYEPAKFYAPVVVDLNGQWANRILCDDRFDIFYVDSNNSQGSSTDLKNKDTDEENQMEFYKR